MTTSQSNQSHAIRYLNRDEGRIAYEVSGSGPLIVGVPGMGDLRSTFQYLMPVLVGAGFRVAVMDLRGHGDSDATFASYDDEAAAGDIAALIAELGGPAVVIGNSMGAGAAVLAAAAAPDTVSGLVLIGPFVRDPHVAPPVKMLMRIAMTPPFARLVWNAYLPSLYAGTKGEGFGEHRRAIMDSMKRRGRATAFSRTTATSHAPVEAVIGRVQSPTLVVMGKLDPDFPDPSVEADWVADAASADAASGQVVMIDDAGHYPQFQRPDLVNPAIIDFVRAVRAGA
ncbi:alpha/beta fold hydrolase [Spelaeicoccus albus]|uniref:Pimeloyl-ACP methyl ester carboxylesterase n=1 Tax=Spelaeicoccus albus TaxID=1280376 RepID=A0A7Z0AAT8_9MICO|nr:alpha/beta hydrolase [Spelaeicoccus albus]NYI66238.1 pimeloyl-ACP methyl ester carboxylesterase [Spelaeicoccus albus]